MRLRAHVKRVTGHTQHFYAGEPIPTPAWVEIHPADGTYYLLYFSKEGEPLTDTWHQSIAEAKEQACFEFEITDEDWDYVKS